MIRVLVQSKVLNDASSEAPPERLLWARPRYGWSWPTRAPWPETARAAPSTRRASGFFTDGGRGNMARLGAVFRDGGPSPIVKISPSIALTALRSC